MEREIGVVSTSWRLPMTSGTERTTKQIIFWGLQRVWERALAVLIWTSSIKNVSGLISFVYAIQFGVISYTAIGNLHMSWKNKTLCCLRRVSLGPLVAQSVKGLTLGFSSGHDTGVVRSGLVLGSELCEKSAKVSLSFSLHPPYACTCTLSQISK